MDAILAQLPQIEQMCQALYLAHVSTRLAGVAAAVRKGHTLAACNASTATILLAE